MHVVFLNPVGAVGGAERVLLAAAAAVRAGRPDARVSAVLLGPGPLAGRLADLGVNVVRLLLPPALARMGDTQLRDGGKFAAAQRAAAAVPAALGYVRRLRRTLQTLRPTLLHSNGLKTHLFTAAARPRGVPVVWHVHDFYSHRPLMGKLLRRVRPRPDALIAIADAVRRDAEAVLPGRPVFTVTNAVDVAHFAPGPGDPTMLDQLAGLPPADAVRAGLVATYANWKGHAAFLDALARVPGVRGYVVGGPIYATAGSQVTRVELEAQARRLGIADRVGFVPFQPDPAAVYRALDVVAHASTRAEPFGLTIAEGMACGRAVVAASDLVTDGVDGLTHSPGDVPALAAALARLAGDAGLRSRLGVAARRSAEAKFHPARFAGELLAAYDAVAARSG